MRIIRKPEVADKVGLSPVHFCRLERQGSFPSRISLGPNSVGWLEDEIEAWIDERAKEREVAILKKASAYFARSLT